MVICFAYLHSSQNYSIFRSFYQQREMKTETVFSCGSWVCVTNALAAVGYTWSCGGMCLKNGNLNLLFNSRDREVRHDWCASVHTTGEIRRTLNLKPTRCNCPQRPHPPSRSPTRALFFNVTSIQETLTGPMSSTTQWFLQVAQPCIPSPLIAHLMHHLHHRHGYCNKRKIVPRVVDELLPWLQ